MKKYALIAMQFPADMPPGDVMQSHLEAFADVEASDLQLVNEDAVPDTAYVIDLMDEGE